MNSNAISETMIKAGRQVFVFIKKYKNAKKIYKCKQIKESSEVQMLRTLSLCLIYSSYMYVSFSF